MQKFDNAVFKETRVVNVNLPWLLELDSVSCPLVVICVKTAEHYGSSVMLVSSDQTSWQIAGGV